LILEMERRIFWIFLFPAAISSVRIHSSCQNNNTACDNHGDNLLESFPGVETLGECRELCSDNSGCEFFTYFGTSAFPLKNFCQLFRSCETTLDCTGCVTEARGCFGGCSNNVVGAIEDNYVDYITNLSSESECINECKKQSSCNFYTYYLEDDPNSGACILLSSIIEPLERCQTCVTGPVECDNFDDCGFFYNGKQENHMMFTEPGTEFELTTKGLSISTCKLRVLAVGGGGEGDGGGAGSGYIKYITQTLNSSPKLIKLIVGGEGQASNVTIGGSTYRAPPGGNGLFISLPDGVWGGNGYCGGGGGYLCGGDGGTNGGDGECDNGGRGTGEDISKYHFSNFELSAGLGGERSGDSHGHGYGGGGGGILINEDGPGLRANKGEGFGAGGGGGSDELGRPGVIIIECVGVKFD